MARKAISNSDDFFPKAAWRKVVPPAMIPQLSRLVHQIQALQPKRLRNLRLEDFNSITKSYAGIQKTLQDISGKLRPVSSAPIRTVEELQQFVTEMDVHSREKLQPAVDELVRFYSEQKLRTSLLCTLVRQSLPVVHVDRIAAEVDGIVNDLVAKSDETKLRTLTEKIRAAEGRLDATEKKIRAGAKILRVQENELKRKQTLSHGIDEEIALTAARLAALKKSETRPEYYSREVTHSHPALKERPSLDLKDVAIACDGEGVDIMAPGNGMVADLEVQQEWMQQQRNGLYVLYATIQALGDFEVTVQPVTATKEMATLKLRQADNEEGVDPRLKGIFARQGLPTLTLTFLLEEAASGYEVICKDHNGKTIRCEQHKDGWDIGLASWRAPLNDDEEEKIAPRINDMAKRLIGLYREISKD